MSEQKEQTMKTSDTIKPIKLADKLGIRPQQVFSWIRNGQIASTKPEGHYVLQVKDVKTFLGEKKSAYAEKIAKIDQLLKQI